MDELALLNRIPKEHYTQFRGKMIKVGDVLKILKEEEMASLKGFKPLSPLDKGRPKQS